MYNPEDYSMSKEEFEEFCKYKMPGIKNEINEYVAYRENFIRTVESEEIQSFLALFGFELPSYYKGILDPDSQYRGVAYWYNYALNRKNQKMNPVYENLWGIHIMPYCITEEDVIKAQITGDNFNKQKPGGVDYDRVSGNFHKWPDLDNPQYQVVLIPKRENSYRKAGGPGFGISSFVKSGDQYVSVLTVNQNVYFPRINSDGKEELIDSLKKAFSAIFENKYFKAKLEKYEG